jgi:excinuclease ABC subunit C
MEAMLEENTEFDDFGRDWFMPYGKATATFVEARTSSSLRAAARANLPTAPGIYGFVSDEGRLIYVGKSKSLKSRVLSYFSPHHEHEKAGQIVAAARRVLWETQPSEFAALLREQKLISRWQPRYNVVGMPKMHRSCFLCLGRGPAELFYVTYKHDPRARACEGPFHGATRLNRVVEVLNRMFKLRDCNDKQGFVFGDQLTLFDDPLRAGCLRADLKTCLGPCASLCSKKEYERQVQAALDFARSGSDPLVDFAESQMLRAARNLQFELAARYREDWQLLRWINQKLMDNEQARKTYNFIYPVLSSDGRDIWYLVRGGRVEHALAKPKNAEQWRLARQEIMRWAASTQKFASWYDGGANTLHVVTSWFRKNRSEMSHVCSIDKLPTDLNDSQSLSRSVAPDSAANVCSVG